MLVSTGGVIVEGFLEAEADGEEAGTVWHSSRITQRCGSRLVATRSGSQYALKGRFQVSK